ncbi:MAG: hypothetical protein NC409_03145 [Clostridium sp.]|nr:hypothetical protein [Clostridium sp.]
MKKGTSHAERRKPYDGMGNKPHGMRQIHRMARQAWKEEGYDIGYSDLYLL